MILPVYPHPYWLLLDWSYLHFTIYSSMCTTVYRLYAGQSLIKRPLRCSYHCELKTHLVGYICIKVKVHLIKWMTESIYCDASQDSVQQLNKLNFSIFWKNKFWFFMDCYSWNKTSNCLMLWATDNSITMSILSDYLYV